jgi:hypothetical protein
LPIDGRELHTRPDSLEIFTDIGLSEERRRKNPAFDRPHIILITFALVIYSRLW